MIHILAAAPTPPVNLAHYATESWTKGGALLGLFLLGVLLAVVTVGRSLFRT